MGEVRDRLIEGAAPLPSPETFGVHIRRSARTFRQRDDVQNGDLLGVRYAPIGTPGPGGDPVIRSARYQALLRRTAPLTG